MTPAMTARPIAVKNGLNPPTATLVIGTENEKSRTPRNAHANPVRTEALRCEAGTYETVSSVAT